MTLCDVASIGLVGTSVSLSELASLTNGIRFVCKTFVAGKKSISNPLVELIPVDVIASKM